MNLVHSDSKRLSAYQRETLSINVKPYHKKEFDRLCKVLQSGSGFQISFLQFNDPLYRDMLIEKVNKIGKKSVILSLNSKDFPNFQSFEEEIKQLGKDYEIIHLINLENWLIASESMIVGFNYHREYLAQNCNAILLLWLTAPDIKVFAVHAPDMWAWRSAVLRFDIEKTISSFEIIEGNPVSEQLPLREKIFRINEIKDFLKAQTTTLDERLQFSLISELIKILASIGQYEEALEYCRKSIDLSSQIGDQNFLSTALINSGLINWYLGNYNGAMKHYEQALTISREIDDRQNEAIVLNSIGVIYKTLSKYEKAMEYFNESLKINRETGARQNEAVALNSIGLIYEALGNYEYALRYINESLVVRRLSGDHQGEGTSLNNLGLIYKNLGQYEKASQVLMESLHISRSVGDRRGEGTALNNIALIYEEIGKYHDAISYFTDALAISREIGNHHGEGAILNNIGVIYRNSGSDEEALKWFKESLTINKKLGDLQNQAIALNNIGSIYIKLSRFDETFKYLNEALSIGRKIGDQRLESVTLWNLGMLIRNNDLEKALSFLKNALEIEKKLNLPEVEEHLSVIESLKKKLKTRLV